MDVVWAAEAASAEGGSGYWQLAMVLLGIGVLTIFGRWRKARAPQGSYTKARELRERDQEPHRYRDAADQAIVEMLEMSRTLNAQIDTKIRILNRLVKDADDKTAALQKLLAETGARLDNDQPPPSEPSQNENSSASRRLERPASNYQTDLHERIHVLAKEGKTPVEIAKATNLSTTEVNFVLDSLARSIGND